MQDSESPDDPALNSPGASGEHQPPGVTGPAGDTGDGGDRVDLSTFASGPTLQAHHLQGPRRRVRLPVLLFLATCLSTFRVGATDWEPMLVGIMVDFRQLILRNWEQGLVYMGCVLAILMTHELGHFFTTLWYRVPASLPFFIPLPITPIGTGCMSGSSRRITRSPTGVPIGMEWSASSSGAAIA